MIEVRFRVPRSGARPRQRGGFLVPRVPRMTLPLALPAWWWRVPRWAGSAWGCPHS